MLEILGWIVLSVLIGSYSKNKELGFGYGFWWSLFLSPLIGFIIVVCSDTEQKKCPKCAEKVKAEAMKCKHCGHEFSATDMSEQQRIKEIEERISKVV